jgi:hypothetical protein
MAASAAAVRSGPAAPSAAAVRSGPAKETRVHPHLPRRFLHLAGLAGLVTAVAASTGVPATAAAGRAAAAAAVGTAASSRPILLINGELIIPGKGPGGRPDAAALSGQGSFALLFTSVSCLGAADVPAAAMPFVGRGLDPSLFELAALQRRETNGRLPVQLTYRGRRAPSLPGVTITRSARGSARGYLTPRSARKFGAALVRQYLADHARASYGTDGLFAHGLSVALAGTRAPRPVRPAFVMRTLTVKGRNLAGRPDNGDDVLVFNADNCARFGDPIETNNFFRHGVTKFSVPAGHYWAIGQFLRFARGSFRLHLVVLPQFTVSGNTRVHIAERSASNRIAITTARPAVSQQTSFTLIRGGKAGSATSIGWAGINTKFWVSPTSRQPTVGSLQSFTSAELTSPAGAAGLPYAYNLDFPGPPGLIPAQQFVVPQASLATVNERYYQDVPSTGSWTTVGGTAAQFGAGVLFVFLPLKLPGRQIQYMSGGPAILWSSQYWEFTDNQGNLFAGQADAFRSLPAGRHLTENWNRYPLHPAPDVSLTGAGPFPVLPSAARAGNLLTLSTTPFSDNTLGHLGSGFFTGFFGGSDARMSGHFEIDQNGVRLAAGSALGGIPPVRLSSQPSVIRFALSAARIGQRYVLSPASRTVWTWRSGRDTAATVPPSWFCLARSGITRRCAVQPMMTVQYQVAGLAMNGSARPGRQLIRLSVGHIQLASAARVTGARVQVSFNGGQSWQAASVARSGDGQFEASFTAPAGAFVTLRAAAADAAGGSISETIQRAYQIAP